MATKFQKALKDGNGMSIVEFARKLRNADYSEWEKGNKLPSGLARVDIDSRPMGPHGVIYKNYDYAQDLNPETQSPGVGMFRELNEHLSTASFLSKRRKRMMALYKVITDNNL